MPKLDGIAATVHLRAGDGPCAQVPIIALTAHALAEARAAADDLATLGEPGGSVKHAALVFSYPAKWMTQIQPQGAGCSALWAAFHCYSALRRLGLKRVGLYGFHTGATIACAFCGEPGTWMRGHLPCIDKL